MVCGADEIPFADNSFDKVLCHSVFQYFSSDQYARKIIKEMLRVVRVGGSILIMDIPDLAKKILNTKLRKSVKIENRDSLLVHRFYSKNFFKIEKYKIWNQDITGYKNSRVRFNVLIKKCKPSEN